MPSQPAPLVVISIVHWNTTELTLRCLNSLQELEYQNHRIVVVDNASSRPGIDAIAALYPQVHVLRSPENRGFAGGHALALELARQWQAPAICLLNSDAELAPEALSALVEAWSQHGLAIYAGLPLQRLADDSVWLNLPEKYLDPLARPTAWARDRPQRFDQDWPQRAAFKVGAVPGSCLLLPLALIGQHGWMDPDWFLYCEELDYCLRLRRLGVASLMVPAAQVWHGGGGSHQFNDAVANCIHYYRVRNEIVMARRHAGLGTALLIAGKKLLRAGWSALRNPRRAVLMVRGIGDALRGRMGKTLAPEAFFEP